MQCALPRETNRFGLRFTTVLFFLFLFAVCSDIQSRIKSLKTLVSVLCGMYASFTDCDSVQGADPAISTVGFQYMYSQK